MSPAQEEQLKHRFIRRAWEDPEFKARALRDPHQALMEMGVDPPADFEVAVLADAPSLQHWVVPVESDDELFEADLEAVAGGMSGLGQSGLGFATTRAERRPPRLHQVSSS